MQSLGAESYRAFLMTDVVGSTVLTQSQPQAYGAALARHNELAEAVFAQNNGKLLKSRGQGDSLLGDFAAPADAVRAALAFREALAQEPGQMIECRYAVHFGPCYGDGHDYFGHTLNLCARLRDVGHPHQMVTTETVVDLTRHLESQGIDFLDLGWHGLKDIAKPLRLYQFDRVESARRYPKLKTLSRYKMPSFGSAFVGRNDELVRIGRALETGQCVQLLGPAGIGKTRLAARAAETLANERKCPCLFVSLIEAVDAASVDQVIAASFGLRTLAELGRSLEGEFILVVDNCEHVATAAAETITALVQAHPQLFVLATSRMRIALQRCTVLNLDGLDLGQSGAATELFVRVARSHDDTFELNPGDEAEVAEICSLAEGVPLVIELAAYYIHSLSVSQIRERVFDLVRRSTGSGRHESVDVVLRASFDRMDASVRVLAGKLAWFAGGFTIEAADAAAGEPALEGLRKLVEHSLLKFDRTAQPPRYRFLEVIRIFLRGTTDGMDPLAVRWAVTHAESMVDALNREGGVQLWEQELANYRVALSSGIAQFGDERFGLRIASAMARYCLATGSTEGIGWIEQMLEAHPEPANAFDYDELMLYANAQNRLGAMLYQNQELARALAVYDRAKHFADLAGNQSLAKAILLNQGLVLSAQGRLDEARPLLIDSQEFFEREGLTQHSVITLLNLGHLELKCGNLVKAEELLTLCRGLALNKFPSTATLCSINLAACALLAGSDPDPHIEEARQHESMLDVTNKALLYHLMAISSRARAKFDQEKTYRAIVDHFVEEGGRLTEFDRRMESLVQPASS